MSLRVVGYTPEGRRITVDEGPSSVYRPLLLGGSVQSERLPAEPRPERMGPRTNGPEPRCLIVGRCRHAPCVARRVAEAKRLARTTTMTLSAIGQAMGGRDHSTVSYWLREYQDDVA